MPDSENPQPPSRVEDTRTVHQPTEIDEDEYHMRADEYMNAIHERAEEIQEDREDVEVEYSVRGEVLAQL
jgi:frataxin